MSGKVILTGGRTCPGWECECLRLKQSTWTPFPSQLALAVRGPRFSPIAVLDDARAVASTSQLPGPTAPRPRAPHCVAGRAVLSFCGLFLTSRVIA